MIAKATVGKGFYGLLNYLLDEDKLPELLLTKGQLPFTEDAKMLARAFISTAELADRTDTKPVWHFSLSLAAEDRPRINDLFLSELTENFAESMGFEDHQYAVIKHDDTPHPHVHIVVNRVNDEGILLPDKMVKKRAMEASIALEEKFGLRKAKAQGKSISIKSRQLTYAFKPTAKQINQGIAQILRSAIRSGPASIDELAKKLQASNITFKQLDIEGKQVAFLNARYEYFDNISKTYQSEHKSQALSNIEEGLTLDTLTDKLEKYELTTKESYAIEDAATKWLSKGKIRHFIADCAIEGVKLDKLPVMDAVVGRGSDKEQKVALRKALQRLYLPGADIKRSIKYNDIHIQGDEVFSFTGPEIDIIGSEQIDSFYAAILGHHKGEASKGTALGVGKRINSDTLYYYLSLATDKQHSYNPMKVDYTTVKNMFVIDKAPKKAESIDTERQHLYNAVSNFQRYQNKESEIVTYLAKRGFQLQIEKSNIVVCNSEGDSIGLASQLGINMLKRHGEVAKSLSQISLTGLYDKDYRKDKVDIYRALDRGEVNEVKRILSENKVAFTLQRIDKKYIDADYVSSVDEMIKDTTLRTTSTYKKHGKRRR